MISEDEQEKQNKKGFKNLWYTIITIVLLGVIGMYVYGFFTSPFFRSSTGVEWMLFGIFVVLIIILLMLFVIAAEIEKK